MRVALLSATIFLGSLLLFLAQPMVAKMVLPRLGGSPSVWIVCMLFFQSVLLAGYGYAHVLRRLPTRAQKIVHAVVLLVPVFALLITLPEALPGAWGPAQERSPVLWLLATLARTVGPSCFVLATTGPLLQRWLSITRHAGGDDPYFLYAAGNAGSLLGLLAYPFLLEPALPVTATHGASQSLAWAIGYGLYAAGVLACAAALGGGARPAAETVRTTLRPRAILAWVALAAIPSSALLGATQYLTADIATVPLLWIVPLTLYLLTFILAFSRRMRVSLAAGEIVLAALALLSFVLMWTRIKPSLWLLVPLHLATSFTIALVCHTRLAVLRPHVEDLTRYYLWIAAGGALGGVFNALIAPVAFDSIVEYPLAVLAACALVSWRASRRARWAPLRWVTWALPAVLAALFLASSVPRDPRVTVLHQERTFFGVHTVKRFDPGRVTAPDGSGRTLALKPYHLLLHGTTRHGAQYPDPELRSIPTTYYHRTGPIGQIFAALEGDRRRDRVAFIGLGAGTLAAYGRPGSRFTFFEIDPEVARIAQEPRWFSYLKDCRGEVAVRIGDGRLLVGAEPDGGLGLLVLDAFSSDAIPVHLLTREAVALYLRKLEGDGLLAIHVTNQYLDLRPVLEALVEDAGLAGRIETDGVTTPLEFLERKDVSTWAVLARSESALAAIAADPRWKDLRARRAARAARHLWTDTHSDLLDVLRLVP